MNKFPELRAFGQKGEDDLLSFLQNKLSWPVLDLNYKTITDNTNEINDWRDYNKLPDFIVKDKQGLVFFADAKAKKSKKLLVNERDYDEYIKKLIWLPVKVYFLIYNREGTIYSEIYEHNVTKEKIKYSKSKQWDGNTTLDLSDYVKQIF